MVKYVVILFYFKCGNFLGQFWYICFKEILIINREAEWIVFIFFSDTIKAYNHAGEKYSGRYNMKMEIKESGKMKYFEKNH